MASKLCHQFHLSDICSDSMAPKASTMRVAVAGTNELALLMAHYIVTETSHQLVILSRHAQPHLPGDTYPVHVVDYGDPEDLQHAVMGIDTIICTVIGPAQLELLKAAVTVGVRRFAPAEFEGPISNRPVTDLLDRGKHNMRGWLEYFKERNKIQYTVFSCGVLYERFAPTGLKKSRIGLRLDYGEEGDFIINPRNLAATVPQRNEGDVHICMTAAHDVARLVVRSLSMNYWPPELMMVGEKLAVSEIIRTVLRVRNSSQVNNRSIMLGPTQLQVDLAAAQVAGNNTEQIKILEHLAVVEGRYTFSRPGNLRESNQDIKPIKFENWLKHQWQDIPLEYD